MESSIFIDLVRYGHLFAVAIGFGAAFMADYVVLTRLRRGISAETMGILTLCHQLIWGAVIAMWITGICLIGIRTGFAPSAFTPKLFAKLFVVTLLTGNAVIIGRLGLRVLKRAGTRGIVAFTPFGLIFSALISGISTSSWLWALAMGSSRFLAGAPGWLFALALPLSYAAAVWCSYRLLRQMRAGRDLGDLWRGTIWAELAGEARIILDRHVQKLRAALLRVSGRHAG